MNLPFRTTAFCLVFLTITVKFIASSHNSDKGDNRRRNKLQSRDPVQNPNLRPGEEEPVYPADNDPVSSQEEDSREDGDHVPQGVDPSVTPDVHHLQGNECPACFLRREEAKRYRIEYIKRTILDKLQMTSPPNTSNIVLPRNAELTRFMNEYFRESVKHSPNSVQNDGPTQSLSTRLEKMILFPNKPPSTWSIKENTSYAFTFSEKLYNYDVRNAALHLHVRPRRRNQAPSVYYVILRRVLDPPDGSDSPKIKTVSKKKIQLHAMKGHWVVLNMTGVAQEWLEDPQEHNVVQLSLVDADGNNYDDLLDTNTDREYRKRSFMMMSVTEKRFHRFKRSADGNMICPANSQITSCCRYAMVIDFEEIGWDWIIAPRSYDANYCQGECPRMYMLEYAHTHIIESIGNLPNGGTGPCCAPRQMSDLAMLHMDGHENIQYTNIAAMKVDSCHCA